MLAGAAALAVTTGILIAGPGAASAAPVTPGWEPDTNAVGTVAFYDASGNAVTGGNLGDHPAAWFSVASGDGRVGDSKAQLRAYTPREGVATADWTGDSLTASTDYPNAGAPANIASLTVPVVSGAADDLSLADYVGELPNTSTTVGYQDLYELRIYTSGPGQGPSATYFRADIQVTITGTGPDGLSTGTWMVVYPAAP
jgi:hypothetical protein